MAKHLQAASFQTMSPSLVLGIKKVTQAPIETAGKKIKFWFEFLRRAIMGNTQQAVNQAGYSHIYDETKEKPL